MRRLAHLLLRRRKATRMASTTSREVTAAPQTTKATASTSLAPALSDEDKAWLRGLPKVELHVHLDGSFDSSMLYAAARKAAAEGTLPEAVPSAVNGKPLRVGELVGGCSTEGQFRSLCQCKGKRSLLAMIDCFQIFTPAVRGRSKLLESLAELFVQQQAEQGVAYTEVRYSPQLLAGPPEDLSAAAVVDAVTAGLRRGCEKHGVWVNQILCCIALNYEWSPEVADIAIARFDDGSGGATCGVVGIDIAAGEQHFEEAIEKKAPNRHGESIARAREAGLGVTIHAGETGGVEHIRQALAAPLCATRIGHGYAAAADPQMLSELRERGVHVEVCPSSSVETGGWRGAAAAARPVPRWEKHPAVAMREAGVSIGFNSDDPYVFGTALVEDMGIALADKGGGDGGRSTAGAAGSSASAAAAALGASADDDATSGSTLAAAAATALTPGGMGFDRKALVKSVEDAIDASFADAEKKTALLAKLREYPV